MQERGILREQFRFVKGQTNEALDKCATLMPLWREEVWWRSNVQDYSGARDSKEVGNFLFDMEQYFKICSRVTI